MKKFLSISLIFCFMSSFVFAFDLDSTVDDEIRSNYKSDVLRDEALPELPKALQYSQSTTKSDSIEYIKKQTSSASYKGVIKGGTKFLVVNDNAISDGLRKGAKVTFHTKNQIYAKGVLIPAVQNFMQK